MSQHVPPSMRLLVRRQPCPPASESHPPTMSEAPVQTYLSAPVPHRPMPSPAAQVLRLSDPLLAKFPHALRLPFAAAAAGHTDDGTGVGMRHVHAMRLPTMSDTLLPLHFQLWFLAKLKDKPEASRYRTMQVKHLPLPWMPNLEVKHKEAALATQPLIVPRLLCIVPHKPHRPVCHAPVHPHEPASGAIGAPCRYDPMRG